MVISQADYDALVEHARESVPNECCGWMRMSDGRVAEVMRGENVSETSKMYGYRLDSKSLLGAYNAEEEGHGVAIYHSHPRSEAKPSQTDINLADYPGRLQVIVSPAVEPAVRAWWIADGRVEEEDVVVD